MNLIAEWTERAEKLDREMAGSMSMDPGEARQIIGTIYGIRRCASELRAVVTEADTRLHDAHRRAETAEREGDDVRQELAGLKLVLFEASAPTPEGVTLRGQWMALVAIGMAEMLEATPSTPEAPNYLQMDVMTPEGSGARLIVVRPDMPGPHELRRAAEAERDEANAALVTVRALNESLRRDNERLRGKGEL